MTAAATVTVEAPEAGARPTALLPMAQLVRISLYWLGLTAIDAAVGQYISFRLVYTDIRGDIPLGTATTLLTIGGALLAIIVQPTVGSISDYAVTKWGRRKPFIVFGSLLDVVFLVGIANSNTLLALGAFVMLLTFSTNIARGPFQGYVPDLVAEAQVGSASAMVGMMQILGNVTGLVLANLAAITGNLELALFAVAIVELVTMVSVVLRVGKGLPPKSREGRSWTAIAAETWGTDILRERSYLWLVASRLFFLTAGGILFAYVTAYMKYAFGMTQEEAGTTNLVLIVAVVLGNLVAIVPASRLSDRIGRKPVIYAACGIGAAGAAIAALAPAVPIAILGGDPVRRRERHLPRRRLGAHDGHHPAGIGWTVHGHEQRRDGIGAPVRRRDRRARAGRRRRPVDRRGGSASGLPRRGGAVPDRGRAAAARRGASSPRSHPAAAGSGRLTGAQSPISATALEARVDAGSRRSLDGLTSRPR